MSIAITGLGIVCAIGNDIPSVLASLRQKKSGIGTMHYLQSEHTELPVGEVKLSNEEMESMLNLDKGEAWSRTTLMGAIAVRQALKQANIDRLDGKKVALISGTTVGGMDVTERHFKLMQESDEMLSVISKHDCGSTTDDIARICGLDGAETITVSTACSSAVNSIIIGAEMLKTGEADIVIAGGTEALSKFHLNGFNTLMILDKEQCRPFDATRAGLNLGEGAAFVVMQKSADAEDDKALAYVSGYGNRCDAFHQTASSEDGEGAYLAMTEALAMAGLKPQDIHYINAHGTGTPNNDPSESAAIRRVFGDSIPPISSTKAFTGHTTSASGSIETVFSILAMQNGFVPASLGWEKQDDNCITPSTGINNIDIENVVCNSFGFGGNDSSIILSKTPHTEDEATAQYVVDVLAKDEIEDMESLKEIKEFVFPIEARRMGKLMKASCLTSMRVLRKANIERPDAIITATANGMLETSEQFLQDICENGEQLLKPTLFMQSTHNTIGSAIAIRLKCHGYNITYTQGERSLECAMKDAERLIRTGKAKTVLVGCHDEATPLYCGFMKRLGLPEPKMIDSRVILLGRKD
ncbi:MAG: beta-ketoacyl synthase chain length factor [Bacteroidaceae bacterium]|nr:beta-ketoacyl synthase chain length factor [Bacteroidaceae bacterium]